MPFRMDAFERTPVPEMAPPASRAGLSSATPRDIIAGLSAPGMAAGSAPDSPEQRGRASPRGARRVQRDDALFFALFGSAFFDIDRSSL